VNVNALKRLSFFILASNNVNVMNFAEGKFIKDATYPGLFNVIEDAGNAKGRLVISDVSEVN
jgi:hypothetical protein